MLVEVEHFVVIYKVYIEVSLKVAGWEGGAIVIIRGEDYVRRHFDPA